MKLTLTQTCHLLVAMVVLLSGGLAAANAQPAYRPVIAQAQVASPAERNDPPALQTVSAIGTNSLGYLVTVVIPVVLLILMIGLIRRRDV